MMTEVKVGDVVYLNSGSPHLTVTNISIDIRNSVEVSWMDDGELRKAIFDMACLRDTEPK